MTFPLWSQQELVKAFAEDFPSLELRDDDITNPQVIWLYNATTFFMLSDKSCCATLRTMVKSGRRICGCLNRLSARVGTRVKIRIRDWVWLRNKIRIWL